MKLHLQLQTKLKLSITPALRHAIHILQLSHTQLCAQLLEHIEKNPLLEDATENSEYTPAVFENQSNWRDISYYGNQDYTDADWGSLPITLKDTLLWQLYLSSLSALDLAIGTELIDSINEDGYLTASTTEIAEHHHVDEDEVIAVLHAIQQFEPTGCGSRNLSECLSVQLKHIPNRFAALAHTIVQECLPELAKGMHTRIARTLKQPLEHIIQAIALIQTLCPKPGLKIGDTTAQPIVPDVYIEKHQGQWVVMLNHRYLPHLQINRHYAQLVKKRAASTDDHFIKGQLQEARWLIRSVEHRHETLYKVTKEIMAHQHAFLESGESKITPLTLKEIAHACQMHESTISRVTSAKFIYTPHGVFELKHFFSSELASDTGHISSRGVKALIKEVIQQENQKKPLSDCQIKEQLRLQGIHLARRTVAKYREALRIPPSKERRKNSS